MKTGKGKIIEGESDLVISIGSEGPVIVIMGQPRSGKTTVARRLSEKLDLPIIHTDRLRADMRLHCPWCGFDNEIEPWKEDVFIEELNCRIGALGACIVEGASIAPRMLSKLPYDAAILMYRDIGEEDLLEACREHDGIDIWTYKKADTYLLRLFSDYREYAMKWFDEVPELAVRTAPDFEAGVKEGVERILGLIGEGCHLRKR